MPPSSRAESFRLYADIQQQTLHCAASFTRQNTEIDRSITPKKQEGGTMSRCHQYYDTFLSSGNLVRVKSTFVLSKRRLASSRLAAFGLNLNHLDVLIINHIGPFSDGVSKMLVLHPPRKPA